jgi:hypothetical protein
MHVKSIRVAVAAGVVGLAALTACSSPMEAGAAAVVGSERISADELNRNVKEFQAALVKENVTPDQLQFPGTVPQILLFQLANLKQADQVVRKSGIQVSEGEIDQAVAAAAQQGGSLQQQMMAQGVAPSNARSYMRTSIGFQKLVAQYGGGTDEAATERGRQKVQEQLTPIIFSPRYGTMNPARSESSPNLYVDANRFGKTTAVQPAPQPQQG